MSTFAQRVLTGGLSPDPFYGSGPLRSGSYFRRAKSRSVPLLLSAHWGLLPSKFVGIAPLNDTAWCLPSCWVRRCLYSADTFKFPPCRPQWAEARRAQGLVFGAAGRKCQGNKRVSPVAGGPGVRDYEHPPSARCSSERNPRGIFGSFLGKQKGTRPAGRTLPRLKKE